MDGNTIAVMVACHKPYPLPKDGCYLPVEVGAALHAEPIPGFTADNTGENISEKNPHYCELTALYWGWKNLDAAYIGLVHYRRWFGAGRPRGIASRADYEKALRKAPVVLPRPRHYWIETNYSQYIHAHHERDLTVTRELLAERCPAYLAAYDRQMLRRSGHRFNMLVMRRDLLNDYCAWLFDILFALEQRLDISYYDAYNARVFGFIAERLLDVWIETNHVRYTHMPVKNTESQHWLRKGSTFVLRKLGIQVR